MAAKSARKSKTADGAVMVDQIAVADIVLDSDVQPRENISAPVIGEYAEAMRAGAEFPNIIVYRDPESGINIAADGWHRVMAAKEADKATINAEVRPGTKRDAVLYSVSANGTHGLRRTAEDKRRAVVRLLDDAEWGQWSDNAIAEQVGVSQPFVSGLRKKREGEGVSQPTQRQSRDGRTRDTASIGGRAPGRQRTAAPKAPTPITAPTADQTNGHAPVALVPDPEPEGDVEVNPTTPTVTSTGIDLSGDLTVEQFAPVVAALLGKLAEYDPNQVFAAMDSEMREVLADKWDGIISAFDGYSEALEKALEGAPA